MNSWQNKNVPARVFGSVVSLLALGISLVWWFHKPGSFETNLGTSPLYYYWLDHYPRLFTASGLMISLILVITAVFGQDTIINKLFNTNEPGAKFTWFSRLLEYLGLVFLILGSLYAAIYNHMSLDGKSLESIAAGAILVIFGFALPRIPLK